jgi:hypothetical protein
MKTILAVIGSFVFATVVCGGETASVLKTAPTEAVVATQPCAAPCAGSCEVAKVAKISPRHARRLTRIADRQEAREARNCCCNDACNCGSGCCDKPTALVVETRGRKCGCCN